MELHKVSFKTWLIQVGWKSQLYTLYQAFVECDFIAILSYLCISALVFIFNGERIISQVYVLHYAMMFYILSSANEVLLGYLMLRVDCLPFWQESLSLTCIKQFKKMCIFLLIRPSFVIHIRRITWKFSFRRALNNFCMLSYSSLII